MALGEGIRHDFRNRIDVDVQWIDAQIFLAGLLCKPQRQGFQIELVARLVTVVEFARSNHFHGMLRELLLGALRNQHILALPLADEACRNHVFHQVRQVYQVLLDLRQALRQFA